MALVTPMKVDNLGQINVEVLQPMSPDTITEKIRSIDATQIELIGRKIVETILKRLGPDGKYEAEQLVFEKNKKVGQFDPETLAALGYFKILADQFKGKNFLTKEQTTLLMNEVLQPVKADLEKSFSTPSEFIKNGLGFFLSNQDPEGLIADAARKNAVNLNMNHIPLRYRVRLELDQSLTQKHRDLSFSIKELSDIVEFNNILFILKSSEIALI